MRSPFVRFRVRRAKAESLPVGRPGADGNLQVV